LMKNSNYTWLNLRYVYTYIYESLKCLIFSNIFVKIVLFLILLIKVF
jgi:hypothetical protein